MCIHKLYKNTTPRRALFWAYVCGVLLNFGASRQSNWMEGKEVNLRCKL